MSAVTMRHALPGEFRADRREALRYLGYGRTAADDAVLALFDSCEKELLSTVRPRACWMRVPVAFPGGFTVDLGFGPIESVTLSRHLEGCHSALLFAATLGIEADRLISRWSRLRPSRGAVLDALGSAAIETWCDIAEKDAVKGEGEHCSRFSPGYGDFALEHQPALLRCLDSARTLGVTLSESLLMTPAKSVSAVIGLGASSRTCGGKCMSCNKENCIYREVLV